MTLRVISAVLACAMLATGMANAQDKQDKLVEGYEAMRTFFGEQNFRRIDFK